MMENYVGKGENADGMVIGSRYFRKIRIFQICFLVHGKEKNMFGGKKALGIEHGLQTSVWISIIAPSIQLINI